MLNAYKYEDIYIDGKKDFRSRQRKLELAEASVDIREGLIQMPLSFLLYNCVPTIMGD